MSKKVNTVNIEVIYSEEAKKHVQLEVEQIALVLSGEGSNEDKKARARFHLNNLRTYIHAGIKAGAEAEAKKQGVSVARLWLENRVFGVNASVSLKEDKDGKLELVYKTTPAKYSDLVEVENSDELKGAVKTFKQSAKATVNGFGGVGTFKDAKQPSRSEKYAAMEKLVAALFGEVEVALSKTDFEALKGTGFFSIGLDGKTGAVVGSVHAPKFDAAANLIKAHFEGAKVAVA